MIAITVKGNRQTTEAACRDHGITILVSVVKTSHTYEWLEALVADGDLGYVVNWFHGQNHHGPMPDGSLLSFQQNTTLLPEHIDYGEMTAPALLEVLVRLLAEFEDRKGFDVIDAEVLYRVMHEVRRRRVEDSDAFGVPQ